MNKTKRNPPVAKSLIKNSISAYLSAIEIHNKPNIEYRYEIVIILVINAWELLLKAYIYKFYKKDHKILNSDGTSKTLDDCLCIVQNKLGKDFLLIKENIEILSDYRNMIIHFYSKELDIVVYALLSKNTLFYSQFLQSHFNIDLANSSNLILLPIGFRKSISPIDFVSNQSILKDSGKEVKNFILKIVQSSKKLSDQGIDEPIFIDFNINLTNVRNTKNADIIAGINNTQGNPIAFEVIKKTNKYSASQNADAQEIRITRDKTKSQGIIMHEELSQGIFEEINNLIDMNHLLNTDSKKFILGEELYYRIYSERHHVSFNIELFETLSKIAFNQFYCPYLFWITKLPPKNIAKVIVESLEQYKYPCVNSLIQFLVLLSDRGIDFLEKTFKQKYSQAAQAPNYYYSVLELLKNRNKPNLIYKALRISKGKEIDLKGIHENAIAEDITKNKGEYTGVLSKLSLSVFEGEKANRSICRTLDNLIYGQIISDNSEEIINEIEKYNL